MAKRSNPIKALKVKIINIVLYPEEAQKTENYIEYFKKIFEDPKIRNYHPIHD